MGKRNDCARTCGAIGAVVGLFLTGCKKEGEDDGVTILPPSITVEGALQGVDGIGEALDPVTLTVKHPVETGEEIPTRLAYHPGGGLVRLEQVDLAVTESTGLPLEEEFAFLSLSRFAPPLGSDDPASTEYTDAPGWRRAHTGDLAVVRVRKDDISLPSVSFSEFAPAAVRRPGGTWLARIEDDDRRLPWRRAATEPNCIALPAARSLTPPPPNATNDCFDFETLCGMLLANIAVGVTDGLGDADIPLTDLTASMHRLYVVPHLPSGAPEVPGFGLVYATELRASTGPITTAEATIYAPMSFHFRLINTAGGTSHEIFVDPIGPAGTRDWLNLDRVTIVHDGWLGGIVANQIKDVVQEELGSLTLPPVTVGSIIGADGTSTPIDVPLETLVANLIEMVMPQSGPPIALDYSVLALPERRTTVQGTISTLVLTIPTVTISTGGVTPPAGDGSTDLTGTVTVTVLADRSVRMREFLDPNGAIARTTTIGPPQSGEPFELILLE